MAALVEMAKIMFPEGSGGPKALPKTGAAARLINELIAAAKEAIDALFRARGYFKLKPVERKARLGYALDREEALGWRCSRQAASRAWPGAHKLLSSCSRRRWEERCARPLAPADLCPCVRRVM